MALKTEYLRVQNPFVHATISVMVLILLSLQVFVKTQNALKSIRISDLCQY